jgi:hypothetical protein
MTGFLLVFPRGRKLYPFIDLGRVSQFLELYDSKEKAILSAKRTYYPWFSVKDKIYNRVSEMNFIMGWTKRKDTFTSKLVRAAKKGKYVLKIWDYTYKDYTIKVQRRKTCVDRAKIFAASRSKQEIRGTQEELGIELGPNLSVEGVILPPTKMQPQTFRFCDSEMVKVMLEEEPALVTDVNVRGFYAMGSWHTNKVDVEKFGTPSGLEISHWDLFRKTGKKLSKLQFPEIKIIPNSCDLFFQGVNPFGNSGHYCSSFFGKTKKAAFDGACELSKRIWNKVKVSFKPDTSLWSVNGRGRLHCPDSEGNCDIRSRAVLGPEFCVSQIHQVFARPITEGLKKINEADPLYPLHLGSDMYQGRFANLVKASKRFKHIVCFDWSKYDQSISRGQIVLAFAICRASFPKSEHLDNLFLFILSGFLVKRVVGDGGLIYKITKGVATGDPFTSIINTLVNFITFAYLEEECEVDFGLKKYYGDDTVLGTNSKGFSYQKLIDISLIHFGMVLKLESDSGFSESEDIESSACFLKFRSLYGLPARSRGDIIKTISFYQHRPLKCYKEKISRALSFLMCSPFDFTLIKVIESYCRDQYGLTKGSSPNRVREERFREEFDSHLNNIRMFLLLSPVPTPESLGSNEKQWLPGMVVHTRNFYKELVKVLVL